MAIWEGGRAMYRSNNQLYSFTITSYVQGLPYKSYVEKVITTHFTNTPNLSKCYGTNLTSKTFQEKKISLQTLSKLRVNSLLTDLDTTRNKQTSLRIHSK